MVDLKKANGRLEDLLDCVDHPRKVREGQRLYCGLDLGTAFIVSSSSSWTRMETPSTASTSSQAS